ncbi:MAG: tRNA (guanine(46)-N(7))-methyltransferase TrmB [Candidatus Kapaibacteriota bacterium]
MELDFVSLTQKYPFPEKRPRHHVAPHLYVPYIRLKVVPPNYPLPITSLDWTEVFQNGRSPDLIDIGSGRGWFLLQIAILNPEKNILGLEIRKNCVDWLEMVIKGEKIPNVGILWYNVLNGLNFIKDTSIEAVYYLFPDPWPKSKHEKRRAMTKETLGEVINKLKVGGSIFFATDLLEIHIFHRTLLREFETILSFREIPFKQSWDLPVTNKEMSCIRRGVDYYRIIATKVRDT